MEENITLSREIVNYFDYKPIVFMPNPINMDGQLVISPSYLIFYDFKIEIPIEVAIFLDEIVNNFRAKVRPLQTLRKDFMNKCLRLILDALKSGEVDTRVITIEMYTLLDSDESSDLGKLYFIYDLLSRKIDNEEMHICISANAALIIGKYRHIKLIGDCIQFILGIAPKNEVKSEYTSNLPIVSHSIAKEFAAAYLLLDGRTTINSQELLDLRFEGSVIIKTALFNYLPTNNTNVCLELLLQKETLIKEFYHVE